MISILTKQYVDSLNLRDFQASTEQLNVVSVLLNDGPTIEPKADLDNKPYWTNHFTVVQAEESWIETELRNVGYMDEAQDFLANTVIDDEVELLESEIVMIVDKAGRSTSMACGIMVSSQKHTRKDLLQTT